MPRKPVYKVVRTYRGRRCSVDFVPYRDYLLEDSYKLFYDKDTITKAIPGTLGIFCFKHKHQAEDFADLMGCNAFIIKVRPIGRGKTPKFRAYSKDFIGFYKMDMNNIDTNSRSVTDKIPEGTICYPAVEVLT